ncbi:hypothetical protein [Rhodanobacter sp. OR92]|uniref:DUF7210 family protein n=1 Tax=Rhodanobacter sp. OR92 TaxID=1076524 RepID=UPI00041D7263|nr:hypothetical protein [Rhodanobacter sp. OR92]
MQIILNHPHTHAGTPYPAGTPLDLAQRDAEWLVSIGVANFKPGVHRRAGNSPSAVRVSPAAGEPAAGESRSADQPSTDDTGDTP